MVVFKCSLVKDKTPIQFYRSGQKLLLQQQEMERKIQEYNDYHNKLMQNKPSLLNPEKQISIQSDKYSSPTHSDKSLPPNPNHKATSNTFSQNSGSSRLELTSREVSTTIFLWDQIKMIYFRLFLVL